MMESPGDAVVFHHVKRNLLPSEPVPIHVVAAVVRGHDGRILISQRPKHKAQGGLWEFPGGKIEPGESRWQALCRELEEELAIKPHSGFPLTAFRHDYTDISVFLDFWVVDGFSGDPCGREGQPFAWVPLDGLTHYSFPDANLPVIASLMLPDGIWITPDAAPEVWSHHLSRSDVFRDRGYSIGVQFRAPRLPLADYIANAHALNVSWPDIAWIWNTDPAIHSELPRGDLHLASRYLMQPDAAHFRDRIASHQPRRVYAAVHDREEYAMAARLQVDAMLVSPVKRTKSHHNSEPMGWEAFADLALDSSIPLFALGGVSPADMPMIRAMGGRGWAGIRWMENGI